MPAKHPPLRPKPEYLKAFATIMSRIERALGRRRPQKPITVCVGGGAAMHFYIGARYSDDIDAKFLARVLLDPAELEVAYRGEDGRARLLYLDTQYSNTFALIHENAYREAIPISLKGVDARRLDVRLLSPLDLAVSKLGRFSEQDQDDIRALSKAQLIEAEALRSRAEAALPDYVGNIDRVKTSIAIACRIAASPERGS